MKRVVFTLIVSCLFVGSLSAQKKFDKNVEYSHEKSEFSYDIEIEEAGLYEIIILGTNGERVAQPLEQTRLRGGVETIKFDTKFWPPGQYRMVVNKEGFPHSSQTFTIRPRK